MIDDDDDDDQWTLKCGRVVAVVVVRDIGKCWRKA